jgi:hypothetical protein
MGEPESEAGTEEEEFTLNEGGSILREVHVGDLVELVLQGVPRGSVDYEERIAGYISALTQKEIGVTATHPRNRFNGYAPDGSEVPSPHLINVSLERIKKYSIL